MIKYFLFLLLFFSSITYASHYSNAEKMYKSGKYNEGLNEVKTGLRKNSKDWKLYYVGGKIRTALGDNKKAVANFELAHKYNPKGQETLRLLVKYSKKIGDDSRVKKYQAKLDALQNSYTKAKKVTNNSTSKKPLSFNGKEATFEAIDKAIENGDFDYAYDIIKKNMNKYNKDTRFYYYAGIVRYERNQFNDAKINFNIALKDKMKNYKSYYYLGMIFEKEKDWGKSSANYKIFLNYPVADNLKKELELKVKDFTDKKASQVKADKKSTEPKQVILDLDSVYHIIISDTTKNEAKKAVSISKNRIKNSQFDELTGELITISSGSDDKQFQEDIEWSVANIYLFLGLNDKASNSLRGILTRYPNSKRKDIYKLTRANALSKSSTPNEAINLYKEILSKGASKDKLLAYAGIIDIHLRNKDYSRALVVANQKSKYIDDNERYNIPAKIEVLYTIADINFKMNKTSEAKKKLQEILTIKNEDDKFYKKSIILLGDLEYKGGDSKQALKYYKMYLDNHTVLDKYDDNNSWVLFQIANCYRNLKNLDQALDYYDKLIKEYPETDIWVKSAKWKKNDTIWQSRYQKKYDKILE